VFEKFDEDHNGYIEKEELKHIAKALNVDLSPVEVNSMIRSLDFNHDGKISPKEFQYWWLTGRTGSSGTFSQII
jgi:Ca2+-binding EF-hand superfamily protein